jgi:phosphomannomutase / phosphoglucomutase
MRHSPIDHKIFRAYDVRGLAHEQLTEDACRLIGRAFGTELRERYGVEHPRACVGRDARVHSPAFEAAVIEGLLSAGCKVLRIGMTPSPVNYFTVCDQDLDGGVQVTASHNPAHDNGLKLSLREAEAFAGEELQELRRRIEREGFASGEGSVDDYEATKPYLAALTEKFAGAGKGLTVVVDGGNGVAGPTYCEALRKVGARVVELYTEPDGTFPNHAADPSKRDTLKELQRLVQEEEADAGFAYDGDGDRLGLVDETGAVRSADEILLLLAHDHLQRFPGAPVIFTVSNSGILRTEIEAAGGKPVMSKVGHSFVEHAMREHGALLGGEQSGHFFVGEDYFGFDDALVATLRLMSIMNGGKATLSEMCGGFPTVYQADEYRPRVPDERKGDVVKAVTKHFMHEYEVDTLDGVRIDFGDGAWAGIRQSNTSPCLSVCIEARSPEKLQEVEKMILSHLESYPEVDLG